MNLWPGLDAYNSALADPGRALLPAGFSGARTDTNAWGQPLALSGGFAYIYSLRLKNGSRKALRVFHSAQAERLSTMKAAYADIAALRSSRLRLGRYLAAADWHDQCLNAGGRTVPGIIMHWVDEPILGSWLEKNYTNPAALAALRQQLAHLQSALLEARMVHGDLQTGNIAVAADGSLLLLDYDGFRRDSAERSWENGHLHFMHPDPNGTPALADRFPFIVMDLGLAALEQEPGLFSSYAGRENILFCAEDYENPLTSPAIRAVSAMPGLERAMELFIALCRGPATAVPTLQQFRQTAGLPYTDSAAADAAGRTTESSAQRTRTTARAANASSGGAAQGRRTAADQSSTTTGQSGPYRSQYSVLDPLEVAALAGLVGQKVELVGRISSIKRADTKYGQPYAFANFTDWRRSGIKLIWWSEGLEAFAEEEPDQNWEGRWVSVTGLVDAPYQQRYGTLSYSITVSDPSQLRFISAREAGRRLHKSPAGPSTAQGSSTNSGTSGMQSFPVHQKQQAQSASPSNAELLARLPGGSSSVKPGSKQSASAAGAPVPVPRQKPAKPLSYLAIAMIIAFLFWLFTL